ncbi:FMN-dependent NADPH-azoreductase [compost metagenome]
MKGQILAADAVLFVTPEYNRSIPGVLKNAIDTASRPYGDNAFAGKPAAVIGSSIGAIGSALAQQHLRNVLVFVNLAVMAQPEAFVHFKEGLIEADGTVTSEGTRKFLQDYVDAFLAWIKLHHKG